LPVIVDTLIQWLPPVALAKIFWASFSSGNDYQQVFSSFSEILVVSGVIFGFIIWRIKQLDR